MSGNPDPAPVAVGGERGGGGGGGGDDPQIDRCGSSDDEVRVLARRHTQEALAALLLEERALRTGTYYSTVDQVWGVDYVDDASLRANDLKALMREEGQVPSFVARRQTRDSYEKTVQGALHPEYEMMSERTMRSGSSGTASSVNKGVWPKDVLGSKVLFGTRLAHLVPASRASASLYGDVAMCALGLGWHYGRQAASPPPPPTTAAAADDDEVKSEGDMAINWETIQKAIHGCRWKGVIAGKDDGQEPAGAAGCDDVGNPSRRSSNTTAKKPRLEINETAHQKEEPKEAVRKRDESTQRTSRQAKASSQPNVPLSGLKHMVPNKIRLAGRKDCFDDTPCVLIVPAMDLTSVLSWNGEGYPALFLVGEGPEGDPPIETVCTSVRLTEKGEEGTSTASPDQIERGRLLLAQVVRGMAYSLLTRSSGWDALLGNEARNQLLKLRTNFEAAVAESGGVAVPEPRRLVASATLRPHRVRLVAFGSAIEPETEKHPAPDPLLLAVRAAINWSRRHNQDLLSCCERSETDDDNDDDDDDDDDSLDQLAIQIHQEAQDEARRARMWGVQRGADARCEDAAIPGYVTIPSL